MQYETNSTHTHRSFLVGLVLTATLALTGCGGTKMLKDPDPIVLTNSLASGRLTPADSL